MGLFKEFRLFVLRGSAADMGIGLVLGAAFSGFIDSLVTDVLLPPVGVLLAKMNFSNLFITLGGSHYQSLNEAKEAGAATINYGLFITSFIRFVIILFVMFLVIRQLNRWKKPGQHPVDAMMKKECPYCRMSIPSKAIKCPNCSSDLDDKKEESSYKPKSALRLKIK
ncbi:large conductance mechanosensitive channel protein MscL [Aquibacillus sp. LR5S19]|uniref:Large-conductance mechanosensitive channel n=1 Tax=Aquibacillus rhizosphaerae TaxID=3051431 RepID=A0ABT7L5M4_9BACI|nr:large conductance mechanosensitive channel protein MscL [Aquibacillus sp. LR5S19]MDL4841166.1 large conductance mechanosensitive channel protein MscL [Aquibacillus sp. LR5S19]